MTTCWLTNEHVRPPRCGVASRKPRALSWDRTQASGALARGFTNWAIRAPNRWIHGTTNSRNTVDSASLFLLVWLWTAKRRTYKNEDVYTWLEPFRSFKALGRRYPLPCGWPTPSYASTTLAQMWVDKQKIRRVSPRNHTANDKLKEPDKWNANTRSERNRQRKNGDYTPIHTKGKYLFM